MDGTADGPRSMEDNFSYNNQTDVTMPRDNCDRDKGVNKSAVNQELDSTQDHYLQIAVSLEKSEIPDTVCSSDRCQKTIENRKCDHHENLADVSATDREDEKAGYISIALDECRICQSGGNEALINPCKCSGSTKWVHESCIVKWFQISETSSCELCSRDVLIKKKTKPFYQWHFPRGDLGPCSRVDLWYLFVTVFSVATIIGFGIFHLLVKSKEPETTAVFGAIYALCGVMILLRVHYFYMWFTRRSAFWRKWKTMNRVWTVAAPRAVLDVDADVTLV